MNQLMSISWAQSFLIEAGVVLQVVAICALIRDKLSVRMLPPAGHEFPDDDEEEMESQELEEKPAKRNETVSARNWRPKMQTTMTAGHLAKTAKVKFKQSFKFRE